MGETRKAWPIGQEYFQTEIMLRIGKLANPENAEGRDRFISVLETMTGRYVDILKDFDLLPNPERDVLHFEVDWFPAEGNSRWFPKENGQALEQYLREQTLAAFVAARDNNLPLEYWWHLPSDDPTNQFFIEADHDVLKDCVILARKTPYPQHD